MTLRRPFSQRLGGAAALLALCLSLTACLLSPGRFAAKLDVRQDGRFSFAYTGEIYLLGLSKLAEMGEKPAAFAAECYQTNTLVKRPCTAAETAEQRAKWNADQVGSPDKQKRESEAMKALLGGIDPSSPQAAEDLAARLRRQAGWRRVDYKGDGLFDVDFAITGTLDRDFVFPTFERFPLANAFVSVNRHQDGTLRIDAPGFAAAAGNDSLRSLMLLGAAGKDNAGPPRMPVTEGAFTLTTDAVVLANNTDEGPQPGTAGQSLHWAINARSVAAPTALLRLGGR